MSTKSAAVMDNQWTGNRVKGIQGSWRLKGHFSGKISQLLWHKKVKAD